MAKEATPSDKEVSDKDREGGRQAQVDGPPQQLQVLRGREHQDRLQGRRLLKYFITDRGKLVPRRLTGNCAKHQREIATAVNRARMIALMPFAVTGT